MAVKKKSTTKKAPIKKASPKKAAVKTAAPRAKAAPRTKTAPRAKAAVKKAAPRTPAVKKAVAAPKKATAITTKQTKTQIIADIAETTGLSKKDVGAVFSAMSELMERHLKKRGSGEFTIPEAGVKVRRIRKPATKARKMISPFSGEEITVKAKPARNQVKITPLKALKDSVNS